jgi:D-threo-aldose 1-dehydrogenase
VILGSALHSGALATGAKPDARYGYGAVPSWVAGRLGSIAHICKEHGGSLLAAGLQFPLAHPTIASVLLDTTHPGHLVDACVALEEPTSLELWQLLRDRSLVSARTPPGESTQP